MRRGEGTGGGGGAGGWEIRWGIVREGAKWEGKKGRGKWGIVVSMIGHKGMMEGMMVRGIVGRGIRGIGNWSDTSGGEVVVRHLCIHDSGGEGLLVHLFLVDLLLHAAACEQPVHKHVLVLRWYKCVGKGGGGG